MEYNNIQLCKQVLIRWEDLAWRKSCIYRYRMLYRDIFNQYIRRQRQQPYAAYNNISSVATIPKILARGSGLKCNQIERQENYYERQREDCLLNTYSKEKTEKRPEIEGSLS